MGNAQIMFFSLMCVVALRMMNYISNTDAVFVGLPLIVGFAVYLGKAFTAQKPAQKSEPAQKLTQKSGEPAGQSAVYDFPKPAAEDCGEVCKS